MSRLSLVKILWLPTYGSVAERSIAPDCKSGALTATEVRILPGPHCGQRIYTGFESSPVRTNLSIVSYLSLAGEF